MKPKIEATSFGSITIDGQKIRNDVILRLDGSVKKRKKKLSKRVYGTSHTISLDEAKHVYEEGAELLIIGTGRFDSVRLSEEAQANRVTAAKNETIIDVKNLKRILVLHFLCHWALFLSATSGPHIVAGLHLCRFNGPASCRPSFFI